MKWYIAEKQIENRGGSGGASKFDILLPSPKGMFSLKSPATIFNGVWMREFLSVSKQEMAFTLSAFGCTIQAYYFCITVGQ